MQKIIINTKEEARQYAIDWSSWVGTQSLSYQELADWAEYFQDLAERFDLQDEYIENGIL